MPSPERGTWQALRLDLGANKKTILKELEAHLSEFYGECLRANKLQTGDISPARQYALEVLTGALAIEIYRWLQERKGLI